MQFGCGCCAFLEHFGHKVRPDPLTVGGPRLAEFPLVLLVLVLAAQDQHQSRHDRQVVDQQVHLAGSAGCGQYPRPLDEQFSEVVRVPNDAPPS